MKSGAFFAMTTGVLGLMGGLLQINPVWQLGSAGAPGSGSLLYADPVSDHEALTAVAHGAERKALSALRQH